LKRSFKVDKGLHEYQIQVTARETEGQILVNNLNHIFTP